MQLHASTAELCAFRAGYRKADHSKSVVESHSVHTSLLGGNGFGNLGASPATLRVSAGKSPGRDVGTLQDHVNLVEGRRAQLMGDKAKARTDYQDFFILRKDADPDIPNPA